MKRNHCSELWDFEDELVDRNGDVTKPTIVLGVDGGATTTISICLSSSTPAAHPNVVARAVTGSSNFNSVSEETAKRALEQSMAEVLMLSRVPRVDVRVVCLALSGVNSPPDAERVLSWLREIFPCESTKCYVYNDAVAALASGTAGRKYGCVLIAGTGTIAYGFNEDGKMARAAGCGPLLGDQGSGHAISSNALAAVMRAHDGRGPPTTLTAAILKKLDLTTPEEIVGWVYADTSWARVAALVPTIKACAKNGDEVAIGILEDAAEELAISVKAVVRALKLSGHDGSEPFPFVMVGGVLEHEEGWDLCKPLIAKVTQAFPGVQAIQPSVEPAVGAALVAWRHNLEDSGSIFSSDFKVDSFSITVEGVVC
ncbi:N-acetylglucosamine kinase [Marchantia polymorpha subsp. ruderalis]|nr:hypothetical protein MARPO_0122s0046 [Marchantia polymorpha]BBN02548.1 hypothetical protein Mp_2g16170 [Marchantia polymorpha subsp. ruderalis]|eukprot:PTQ30620.1 hypothetical protein MARPO_0122s0046 [Marchantia polymorpha]